MPCRFTVARPAAALMPALLLAACATPAPQSPPPSQAPAAALPAARQPADETPQAWFRAGAERAASQDAMRVPARNVILFVGDGMSIPTVSAARIYAGQRDGGAGEENLLAFERFDHTALSKTYNTDQQTPDSAGTMSAMATGIKTRAGVISIDQSAARGDCVAGLAAAVPTLMELAEDAGLATGVVSTARITHATPAASYAHSADRDWEADSAMPAQALAAGCRDIARQLVEFDHGDGLDVVLGGGRAAFLPSDVADPEYPDKSGQRADGVNLVEAWQQRHADGRWVWNAAQFSALDDASDAPVLGLFEPSHLQYELDRAFDAGGEPSLAELTGFAIRTLAQRDTGYVLLVEAGRIDHAHHAGNAQRALADTVALSEAVAVADRLSGDDTLIVVTADHAHTMTFAGYPGRGNPILGLVAPGHDGEALAGDAHGRPYTTLGYANGPGYVGAPETLAAGDEDPIRVRPQLSEAQVTHRDYRQEAAVPLSSETHGGDDVGIYARGPGAQALRGVLEQNVIFHVLVQAQPALRAELCRRGGCDARQTPLTLTR